MLVGTRLERTTRRWPVASCLMLWLALLLLPGCVERSVPPGRNVEPIGPLFEGQVVQQPFLAEGTPIVAVDVRFGTYARRNDGVVSVQLFRPGESDPLRTAQVPAAELGDGVAHRFRFSPLQVPSAGESLLLRVTSDAPRPNQGVAVWAMPSADRGNAAAVVNGALSNLSLVWSPVYATPWPRELLARAGALLASGLAPWVALLVVGGPGLLFAALLLDRRMLGTVGWLAAAPGFGLAVAPLLFLAATLLGASWSGIAVWLFVAGCLVSAAIIEIGRHRPRNGAGITLPGMQTDGLACGVGLVLIVLAGLAVRDVALAGLPAPPGADSYHHAVITQLLIEQGMVPSAYRPYAPIDSFSYHFGFHGVAALIGLAAGLGGREAVALAAPLVNALIAPSFFVLALAAGLGPRVGLLAAGVVALLSPFPAALLDLGRAPQADALAILPLSIALALLTARLLQMAGPRLDAAVIRVAVAFGVVAAGLFLTHYRVVVFLLVMVLLVGGMELWRRALNRRGSAGTEWGRPSVIAGLVAAAVALVGVLPWLVRLSQQFSLGIRGSEGRYGTAYYSLERLGPALTSPATVVVLTLALAGLVIAIRRRQQLVPLLGGWALIQLALSNPAWLPLRIAGPVDVVTVTSSLFLALAPAAAVTLEAVYCQVVRSWPRAPKPAVGVLAGLLVLGAAQVPGYVQPAAALLTAGDVEAARWAARATPPSSRFAVNANIMRWEPDYITPSDGGYWLPLLAARSTTLLPVLYPGERGIRPIDVEAMEEIARSLGRDPTSEEARSLLRHAGVTHLYLGVQGGPIDQRKLEANPSFRAVYRGEGVTIFELVEGGPVASDPAADVDPGGKSS